MTRVDRATDNVDTALSFSQWAIEAGRSAAAEALMEIHDAWYGGLLHEWTIAEKSPLLEAPVVASMPPWTVTFATPL